ncbi:MAG: hypothetical protein LBC02_00930 [Planctomycetaceae bacterium]|nr:hypothetical protein [Planctomycetaceae bacterium]
MIKSNPIAVWSPTLCCGYVAMGLHPLWFLDFHPLTESNRLLPTRPFGEGIAYLTIAYLD